MGEIKFVGTGETRGYPYLVCKKKNVSTGKIWDILICNARKEVAEELTKQTESLFTTVAGSRFIC